MALVGPGYMQRFESHLHNLGDLRFLATLAGQGGGHRKQSALDQDWATGTSPYAAHCLLHVTICYMQKRGPSWFVAVSCRCQDVMHQDFTERLLVDVAMVSQPQKPGFRKRSTLDIH